MYLWPVYYENMLVGGWDLVWVVTGRKVLIDCEVRWVKSSLDLEFKNLTILLHVMHREKLRDIKANKGIYGKSGIKDKGKIRKKKLTKINWQRINQLKQINPTDSE